MLIELMLNMISAANKKTPKNGFPDLIILNFTQMNY